MKAEPGLQRAVAAVPGRHLQAVLAWMWKPFIGLLGKLHLAQKLMLIYTVVLGITITTFAYQLINATQEANERSFLNDTQNLLQESVYDIESNMDVCYRAVSSLSGDYDIMSFLKDWKKDDNSDIFNFSMSMNKKVEQIMFLSTGVYQFRAYIDNDDFPEIGSSIYNESRLEERDVLERKISDSTNGYWLVNHDENNFNTSTRIRRKVVSLYMPLRYSKGAELGIVEVSMPVEVFFRHMFYQSENGDVFTFIENTGGDLIYNTGSKFAETLGLDGNAINELLKGYDRNSRNGRIRVKLGNTPVILVYSRMDNLDCTIFYLVSVKTFSGSLMKTTLIIVLESLLSLLVLSVLTYFLTTIVFKKMKQIITSMRKVGEGDFGVNVNVGGQDEMSEMAYHFNKMSNQLGNLIDEVVKKQEAKKNAEIHALFSQINSHFLINTLENIRMLAEVDGSLDIADAITSLGKFLRYGLKWTSEYAMLQEEVNYIRNYINLINLRYDFAINLETSIPEKLKSYKVLKISLQPIVENAILRGILPLSRDGLITVKAFADSDFTRIEITDNGAGMDEERLNTVRAGILSENAAEPQEKNGNGIGLRNVSERIRLVYGGQYGIDIDSRPGEYTKVTMLLPPLV